MDGHHHELWQETLETNLVGPARLVAAALPHLRQSDSARIVNVASTEAFVATPGFGAYAASKAGVAAWTRTVAVELGAEGITVNCLCPGPVETHMTAHIPDDVKASYARRRVPLGRYGQPEEIAHAVLSLCLPGASFINGACLVVDGGMSIKHL